MGFDTAVTADEILLVYNIMFWNAEKLMDGVRPKQT